MSEVRGGDTEINSGVSDTERTNGHRLDQHDVLLGADSDLDPALSVVIPTLNEEEGIGECIERVRNALVELQEYGEIVVSDSSSDRTPEIAREMGAIVVTPDQSGYGYAYRYAFARTRGEYIVMGDADTTYDFEDIPKLLEPVRAGEADMCMGTRLDGEIRDGAMPPLHQYIGNPLLTRFLNVFYDAGVSDSHSGFRVFSRAALDEMDLQSDGMEFASEMIMEAGARDLVIAERPIIYYEREGEATLSSFEDDWRHVKFMLMNAPGYLFTVPGAILGVLGVGLMLASFANSQVGGIFFGEHTVIAGSLLSIVGYQIGSLAIFSSVATNPIRQPEDPITRFVRERFQLKHGATVGTGLLVIGGGLAAYLGVGWLQSGLSQPPYVVSLMIAFTAVILGLQTVFYSFFISMLAQSRDN